MQFSMRNFASRNGMNTQLQLIDADSGGLVWTSQSFQDINNRMDSPQDLAVRAVQNLVGELPYRPQNY
jgi:TolB-like protein